MDSKKLNEEGEIKPSAKERKLNPTESPASIKEQVVRLKKEKCPVVEIIKTTKSVYKKWGLDIF